MKTHRRYLAEVRVFEQAPGDLIPMDYVNDTIASDFCGEAISEAEKIARELGGKIKIVVIDQGHHSKCGSWVIYSSTKRWTKKKETGG